MSVCGLVVKVKMQKSWKKAALAGCCPIVSWCEPRQVSGLGRGAHAVSVSCCPIEVGEFKETKPVPDHASDKGEQSGEAVRPLALGGDKSKQYIKQHGRPELPADGMLGVAEEVADFEGLLDLLEEGFDAPATAIQVADAGSSPIEVVGQENHGGPFAVDLDLGFDPAQAFGILPTGLVSDQCNLVVADDVALSLFQPFAVGSVAEVVLGTSDPEDATSGQIEEVGKVDVGLVEDGDLPGLEPGAELHGAGVVMMGSFFDDSKGRKEGLQVQAQMHLRSRLAAAVLGPVHAVGHQRNCRGIDGMDGPFEAAGQSAVTTCRAELRAKRLKVGQDAPEQFFHHVAVAVLVRMRECVATWCNRTSNRSKPGAVVTKTVANIVQPNRVSQLREQKTHHVAPWGERPSLLVHAMLAGKFFRQMRRDKFTKLMQCAAVMFGRRYLFHASDSLVGIRRRPPFFIRA